MKGFCMHPHLLGLKAAVANTAVPMVTAAAVMQVSETVAQAEATDRLLLHISVGSTILSSICAIAWYGFQFWRFQQQQRLQRDRGE
jgi:hypothetical protein